MKNYTEFFRQLAVNGKISLEEALTTAKRMDDEREESIRLLKLCEKNVGTHIGEDIQRHFSEMRGEKFSSVAYNYDRPVGEQ